MLTVGSVRWWREGHPRCPLPFPMSDTRTELDEAYLVAWSRSRQLTRIPFNIGACMCYTMVSRMLGVYLISYVSALNERLRDQAFLLLIEALLVLLESIKRCLDGSRIEWVNR
ncbi:MAG: hypothetical protein J6W59_05960 [Bacteroidales bacterium]|nr:hypothetical protein [Bacteroidales bacterium]